MTTFLLTDDALLYIFLHIYVMMHGRRPKIFEIK